jgi:hypothetical protein
MSERSRTTVCYRVLGDPELGTGLGNVVFVGLDVETADQLGPLAFDGLRKRIATIRSALDNASALGGHLFDTASYTTARHLRAAMKSSGMQLFAPELIAGADIFARAVPDEDVL